MTDLDSPPGSHSYSEVVLDAAGRASVWLSAMHPGARDDRYREQRSYIANRALAYVPGQAVPPITYTEEEHELWRSLHAELRALHEAHACGEFLAGAERLSLPAGRLPQLGEVSGALSRLTGFRLSPVAGLLDVREFYGSLAERRFRATQYIRHPSVRDFSPEPDMIHEVIGHGIALAHSGWAELYELFGTAVRRLTTPAAVQAVSSVFWFTMEVGLVRETGDIKACGAALLSSVTELTGCSDVTVRPLDAGAMIAQEYVDAQQQPVLFCAESFEHMADFIADSLAHIDDV